MPQNIISEICIWVIYSRQNSSHQLLAKLSIMPNERKGEMNRPMSFILCLLSSDPALQKWVCLQAWIPTSPTLNEDPRRPPKGVAAGKGGQSGTVLGGRGSGQSLLGINGLFLTQVCIHLRYWDSVMGKKAFISLPLPQQAPEMYFGNSLS